MTVLILLGIVLLFAAFAAVAATPRPSVDSQGHRTRVPVDDFVVGDLPMVCARTGAPADGLVELESREGSFQTWWLLLLFLGPIGLAAIALMWVLGRRPSRVGGLVPMTHGALADQNRAIGWVNWAGGVPLLAFAGGVAVFFVPDAFGWLPLTRETLGVSLLLAAMVGGVVAVAVASLVASRRRVTVVLDGSGRWVELRNVHDGFAAAVDRQVRARHRAARGDTARPDSSR